MASGGGPPLGMRPGARDPFMPEGDWGNIFHNPNDEWSTENLRGPLAEQDPATDLIAGLSRSASQPPPGKQHFIIERYCILCRDTIPVILGKSPRGIIHFYDASPPGGPLRFSLYRCNNNQSATSTLSGEKERDLENKKRCTNCPHCSENDLEKTENMVHVECLQLAKKKIRRISIPLLARIAHLLRPVVPWTRASTIFETKPGRTKFPQSNICETTDLGQLLTKIHRLLPGEVQRMICEYLPGTLFFSLSSCLEVLDWIEEHRILKDAKAVRTITPHYPLVPQFSLKRLVADTVNILGEICLVRIGSNVSTKCEMEIPVKDARVGGVEYALGLYGVVGFRVLYEDGSYSPWLGSAFGNWFKTLQMDSLRNLCVLSDGLKIVLLDSGANRSGEYVSPGHPGTAGNIFWEKTLGLAQNEKNTRVTIEQAKTNIRGSPGSRIGRYLSLRPTDGKELSLSVYANASRTSCIQVGNDPAERIGIPDRKRPPVTFYLHPGETVKSVRLVVSASPYASGILIVMQITHVLVQTSRNRTFFGGPNAALFDSSSQYSIAEVGPESEMISGLFADSSIERILQCFGVTSVAKRIQQQEHTQLERPRGMVTISLPRPIRAYPLSSGGFLTKTDLLHVREVHVQDTDERITGLLIRRDDGSADTLGRWDPCCKENTRIIYPDPASKSNEALQTLSFTARPIPGEAVGSDWQIVNVSVGCPQDTTNTFVWGSPSQEVAWWFTDDHDHVDYWHGEMADVELRRFGVDYQPVE